jgi:hypothetical protein
MHLWEVEDVVPGVSLSLRDVTENTSFVVHERSASRSIGRREWLAARVIPRGASGAPEMERGVRHIPRLLHDSVRAQLLENRAEFLEHEPDAPLSEFYKTTPPFFHDVWVGAILAPAVPELQNTDGEPLLITEVNYEVLDRNALKSSLDVCPSLDAEANSEGQVSWRWVRENPHGDAVLLGKLTLHAGNLVLEANSAERARRGADLLESLAGSFIRHRATTHEDLTRRVREGVREQTLRGGGGSRPPRRRGRVCAAERDCRDTHAQSPGAPLSRLARRLDPCAGGQDAARGRPEHAAPGQAGRADSWAGRPVRTRVEKRRARLRPVVDVGGARACRRCQAARSAPDGARAHCGARTRRCGSQLEGRSRPSTPE